MNYQERFELEQSVYNEMINNYRRLEASIIEQQGKLNLLQQMIEEESGKQGEADA